MNRDETRARLKGPSATRRGHGRRGHGRGKSHGGPEPRGPGIDVVLWEGRSCEHPADPATVRRAPAPTSRPGRRIRALAVRSDDAVARVPWARPPAPAPRCRGPRPGGGPRRRRPREAAHRARRRGRPRRSVPAHAARALRPRTAGRDGAAPRGVPQPLPVQRGRAGRRRGGPCEPPRPGAGRAALRGPVAWIVGCRCRHVTRAARTGDDVLRDGDGGASGCGWCYPRRLPCATRWHDAGMAGEWAASWRRRARWWR